MGRDISATGYIWPGEEQWSYLQGKLASEGTVTMLNLLKYRDSADYSGHPDETPCSGRAAYERYKKHAIPLVEEYGGRVIVAGAALATIIGPTEKNWDDVVLAEYPSIKAFVEMASSEKYQSFAYHRTAAVADSRLIPIRTSA